MQNKKSIYADHAATTPLCDAAWAAMTPFLREEFGNPSSLYSFAKTPREAVSVARATIAECIGAKPEEIVFTSGGTESDNWVIKGTDGGLMTEAMKIAYECGQVTKETAVRDDGNGQYGYLFSEDIY